MEHIAIEALPRASQNTKGERKQMRQSGNIPASLFGKGITSQTVTVNAKDIAKVLKSETGANTLVDLTLEGKRHLVRLTNLEVDPIQRTLQHVGLQAISAREAQKATVLLELTGEPEPVRLNEALLEVNLNSLDVKALPERMVAHLPLDVSNMQIGDVLYARDVPLPDGFELTTNEDTPVVSVKTAKVVVETEEIPAGELPESATEQASSPAANEAESPETKGNT
ncbi:MAG TPA: 50S ribosomal protein L25 [Armatimonadaceae bacterium]|jgi:large subunit ribosomal protein L25|nr:50S ribosomal protein L25 [Armatimonadaceae bacterium]